MKKNYFFSFITILLSSFVFSQQITTNTSSSLEDLITNNLAQGCVEISNISSNVNGSVNSISSYGYFEQANSNFPFQNGIVLSTGDVDSAGNVNNPNHLNEGEEDWGTDLDLENALGISNTLNATSIEFDFVSVANQIQFNYLLASEEYYLNFPCQYSDGFAFLIKEAGTSDPYTNIAIIPNTSIPVNTNTIHDQIPNECAAQNEQYFEGYGIGDTNFNGRTTVLTATASIIPNVQYHIKLVIADQTDENYDSAVFIEGNSFNATVDLGDDIVTCGQTVNLNGDIQNNLATYQWFLNDASIPGETSSTLIATESGTYRVEISIVINNTVCLIEDEINITLNSEQSASGIPDYMICDDASNDGVETFDLSNQDYYVLASVPNSNYNISYHYSEADAQANANAINNPIQNSSNPQTIYVRIEDTNSGCLAYSSFDLIANSAPEITEPTPIIVCDDQVYDGYTLVDLNPTSSEITNGNPNLYVSYHYTQQDADAGTNPIYSPYSNINPTDTLYIRVYDATTGCYTTTSVTVTVQENPEINTDNQWINSCEQDDDGFEVFDLTEVIADVLDGLTGVTVTFHETYEDSQTGANPIADPTNYQNIVQTFQLIYIRIVDDTTGCYAMTLLELHANIIQTGFDFEVFDVCDDASGDGIADFDLQEIESDIVQGYTDFIITFYETEDDQLNDTNPLNNTIPYTVDTSQTLYATIISDECIEYVTISLIVEPTVDIPDVFNVDYCDENNDGYTSIFLETFNETVSQGVNPSNVKYFSSEIDAINNENILPPYYYNSSNPQVLWVKVTNPQTECYDIGQISINVVGAPTVSQPNDIVICDDNSDGIYIVNLENTISETVANPSDYDISFHTDYNDAYTAANPIANPDNYTTSTQLIYTRVESGVTGCFSIVGFYVYINTVPDIIPISNFENCEANISGVADFYFYLMDTEIINGQPGLDVAYYLTEEDALNDTNPIYEYGVYNNISSPQTIYYRLFNTTDRDCFATSSFELEVGSLPLFNPPLSIITCDDISNDGTEVFNFNDVISEIELGIPEDLEITFHTSEYDANYAYNPLPLEFSNTINPQQIFVRIENGTYCHSITSFDLTVIPAPLVNIPNALVECDIDYDGIVTFDLTVSEVEILDVRDDNIVISYHETLEDTETDSNPILNPENYSNLTNPQTVFVKVNNTVSNCYVTLPLDLIVNLPPPINDFQIHEICHNDNNSFNLNDIDLIIVDDLTDTNITYHSTQSDANTNSNPLDTNYNYSTTNDTIYIRIEYASTGCFVTYNFDLIVNPLPIANTPNNLLGCDDITNDEFLEFDLITQNADILNGQDPSILEVSYHNSNLDANSGNNQLNDIHNAQHQEIIYVRVENNITGCYSTTQFDVIIYPHPDEAQPLVDCDIDYDGLITFDLTTAENDLFNPMPNNIVITYFESEDDLNADINIITNPTNYANIAFPQTVFIKVYNTDADCYSIVPLDLIINLPPPINEFGIFEICDNATSSFDLNEINDVIVDDNTDVIFSYYSNYTDGQAAQNPLSTNYTYTSTDDIIYVRVEYATTGCFYVYPFTLHINPLPIANQPNDIEACDDDTNDTVAEFNLDAQTNAVLGNQDPNTFTVSYHDSDANANNNNNALVSPYQGQDNQTIYVRIENNITGCYSTTSFLLIVNPHPEVPQPMYNCDIDYDSITTFDLTNSETDLFPVIDNDIIITYFNSMEDLDNNTNIIANPTNYTNISNPQTVFIKVYNTTAQCYWSVPLELNVLLPPVINDIPNIEICDNDADTFDFNNATELLINNTTNVITTYYLSYNDAENQQNALDNIYTYNGTSETIFVRSEINTSNCFAIASFNLIVNPNPIANTPNDLYDCDDDYDFLLDFNLGQQTNIILGGQNPNQFTVTYHELEIEALEGTNPISNVSYQAFDQQTIYVRVENNTTGCFDTTQFITHVNRKPLVEIPDQVICLDNLPLTVFAGELVNGDTYLWSTNETTSEIEIDTIGTYWVTVTSPSGCETTTHFNVIESEAATIEVTEILDFSDPNNITLTISGIGNYLYILDDGEPQESSVFENVTLGYHTITIIDLNGCAQVTKEVVVVDAPKFMTPNNDGYFDSWHIIGVETLPGTIINVFDRFGKLMTVLEANGPGWDGTYNGELMPAADYWFVAHVKKDDIQFEVKGHFALRR